MKCIDSQLIDCYNMSVLKYFGVASCCLLHVTDRDGMSPPEQRYVEDPGVVIQYIMQRFEANVATVSLCFVTNRKLND